MPSFTINLTAEQATRLQAAFASPQNPTPGVAEVKAFCISQLRAYVHERERQAATAAIVVTPMDPS